VLPSRTPTYFGYATVASRPPQPAILWSMFDAGDSLRDALDGARDRLRDAQAAVARANAGERSGRAADAAMAQTAQAAIFSEALLNAEHARLAEIKAVTK
jgi:hypothetical protein